MNQAAVYTPLIDLGISLPKGGRIYAKEEQNQPTGSMKDRMVPFVLDQMIKEGTLVPGMTIVEASSGNTGAALAYEGSRRGFSVIIFLADSTAREKVDLITRYGAKAELIDTSVVPGLELEAAQMRGREPNSIYFNQFENPHHIEAYRMTIAAECLAQLEEAEVRIDTFVVGIGTGASAIAVGGLLKAEHNPELSVYAVSPKHRPSDIEGLHPGHLVPQGHFKIWNERPPGFEQDTIFVDDHDALSEALALRDALNISAGPASGAVIAAARKLESPGNCLVLLSDNGRKYEEKLAKWRRKLASPPSD